METKPLPRVNSEQRERMIAFIEARRPIVFIELIEATQEDDEIVDTFVVCKDKKPAIPASELADKILQAAIEDASSDGEDPFDCNRLYEVRLWNHDAAIFDREPSHFARRRFLVLPPNPLVKEF